MNLEALDNAIEQLHLANEAMTKAMDAWRRCIELTNARYEDAPMTAEQEACSLLIEAGASRA